MIGNCMQEHSFIRKDQRNPKKGRERERERRRKEGSRKRERERGGEEKRVQGKRERRRKEGSREDGEAHGRMMDGKPKLGEKCHQITFT